MNKQQIYDYLNEAGLWHEITEHKAVYTMAELADVLSQGPKAPPCQRHRRGAAPPSASTGRPL